MNKGGRPKKYTKEELNKLVKKFEKYVDEEPIPVVVEFCYKNNIDRHVPYDNIEFSEVLNKCLCKKETNLFKGGLGEKINVTMAIFALKQIGWTDKIKTENDTKLEQTITVTIEDD